jgi:hypothetical protein
MTVSDTLQTILKLTGGPGYKNELETATKAMGQHADAEKVAEERSSQLRGALGELGISHALLAGEVAGVVAILKEAVTAFAEEEQVVFRTTVLLRNLGNSLPIERVKQFAEELRQGTSFGDKEILGLIGLEKQFGVADNSVKSLGKSILDATKGNVKNLGLDEVANAVLRGINGQERSLRVLGITLKDTGDKAKNLLQIQKQLDERFSGAAGAERNTLAGSFDALRASLEELMEGIGDKLSTVLIPVLNALTKVVDWLTSHIPAATALLGALIGGMVGGPFGALIGGAVGLGIGLAPSRANPAEQVGTGKGQLATEGTLSKIEANTKAASDTLIKGVLGGSGAVAKGAFTMRDAKLAFGI